MRKNNLNISIFLTLLGLAVSWYLTFRHFQVLEEGTPGPSFCHFNESFDCDKVITSRFSHIGPFPVGGLGVIYFIYLLLPLLGARLAIDLKKTLVALPFLSTIPALLFSVYLFIASSIAIKSWCVFCISLYMIITLTFLLLASVMEVPLLRLGDFMKQYFLKITGKNSTLKFNPHFSQNLIYAAIIFSIGLFLLFSQQKESLARQQERNASQHTLQSSLEEFYNQNPFALNAGGHPMWGTPGAPITIIEFSDYECPSCKLAATNLKPSLKPYQDKIQFFLFHYPLDKSCNPHMQHELHRNACVAAKAALCAGKQKHFWDFHDKLFENQPKLTREEILEYAKSLRLDTKALNACIDSSEAAAQIAGDIEVGRDANVEGTPSIFINGRLLKDWTNPEILQAIIQEELKKAK